MNISDFSQQHAEEQLERSRSQPISGEEFFSPELQILQQTVFADDRVFSPYGEISPPPYDYDSSLYSPTLSLSSSLVVDSSSGGVSSLVRRRRSSFSTYNEVYPQPSVGALLNYMAPPPLYRDVSWPLLRVTSIEEAGEGIILLTMDINTRVGSSRSAIFVQVDRRNVECLLPLTCFFIRAAGVVSNSVLFFLSGMVMHGVYIECGLFFSISYILGIALSFFSCGLFFSSICVCDNSRSRYTLLEVVKFPPSYEESVSYQLPSYAEVEEMLAFSLNVITSSNFSPSSEREVVEIVLSVVSGCTSDRYLLRIADSICRRGIGFILLRSLDTYFFHKYFPLVLLFFFSGIFNGIESNFMIGSGWLDVLYLVCPGLSFLLSGVVAGFSREAMRFHP